MIPTIIKQFALTLQKIVKVVKTNLICGVLNQRQSLHMQLKMVHTGTSTSSNGFCKVSENSCTPLCRLVVNTPETHNQLVQCLCKLHMRRHAMHIAYNAGVCAYTSSNIGLDMVHAQRFCKLVTTNLQSSVHLLSAPA